MIAAISLTAFVALEIVAIWFSWRAINQARTSQGALGWVIFLLSMPWLGVPLFLFFGHHRLRHYVSARRDSEQVMTGIRAFGRRHMPASPHAFPAETLETISDLPVVRGNDMRLLIDGEACFDAIFAAIDAARDYVLVQFYIVHDDDVGRALQKRLIAAARRGVAVRFLYDPVGSNRLPKSFHRAMTAEGIRVADPRDMRGPKNRFQLNFRNHRKIVVVDGTVAFTGGINVGNEYMGRDPAFGDWRDTFLELRGPMVAQLQLVFSEDWHWATTEVFTNELNWEPGTAEADMTGIVIGTGPGDRMETGSLFFFTAIANARERVWIASPYFVPDRDVLTALKHAALQGRDVRLLLPEVIDHHIPWLAAFAYFDEIREAGVQIWRYDAGFMHQKVVLVDESLAAIGTANLDNRSFRLNFEVMAVFLDRRAATAVADMLEMDFENAFLLEKPLSAQPVRIRYGAPVARLFSPIL